jgi:50S ribosomal protein L16 3-hydroxylase
MMLEMSGLGNLTAGQFLRHYWQKKPLMARGALPECASLVGRDTLFTLAARDDLESRLVSRKGDRWRVSHGPFTARQLSRLPRSGWTLLVQGVDRVLAAVQELSHRFAFVPYARFDDVMVSYAPSGGGVGPHFDSYDVFLVQGEGARRWRVSRQRDLALVDGAPLRILRRFRPSREWLLHPGDLLYLPPRWAHDGEAVGPCITYSVGFRAPRAQELGERFLEFMQDRIRLDGIYSDPGLKPQRRPARLPDDMLRKARQTLGRIRWDDAGIVSFLGSYLSEPKDAVVFARPHRPVPEGAFGAQLARRGVRLAPQTRMLFRSRTLFINGEAHPAGAPAAQLLSRLADRRSLPPLRRVDRESAGLLYRWYRAGYVTLSDG